MEKFVWDEKYSVGVEAIDSQHKNFFNICNDIIDVVARENIDRKTLVDVINSLEQYANFHFDSEESKFTGTEYPDVETHKRMHNEFREKVAFSREQLIVFEADLRVLAEEIFNFSVDWLSNHILITDKGYSPFVETDS